MVNLNGVFSFDIFHNSCNTFLLSFQNIKARALYDYAAQRYDELSFVKESIIINIAKHDGNW